MYNLSIHEISDYIIVQSRNENMTVSNLKLQQLLYYAQGWHLALWGNKLFNERIEAWIMGPVIPAVYHKFKLYGGSIISESDLNQYFLHDVCKTRMLAEYQTWCFPDKRFLIREPTVNVRHCFLLL